MGSSHALYEVVKRQAKPLSPSLPARTEPGPDPAPRAMPLSPPVFSSVVVMQAARVLLQRRVHRSLRSRSNQGLSAWIPSSKENWPGCTRYLSNTEGDHESSPPKPIIL